MKLTDCPFCGTTATDLDDDQPLLRTVMINNYDWATVCLNCGARGPIGESKEEAQDLWNKEK